MDCNKKKFKSGFKKMHNPFLIYNSIHNDHNPSQSPSWPPFLNDRQKIQHEKTPNHNKPNISITNKLNVM